MTLSAQELMRQASMTAHTYMCAAVRDIDEKFGDGYAAAHPELVGAYMHTAALDFLATFLHHPIDNLSTHLAGLK